MFTDAQFRLTNFRVAYCLLLVTFMLKSLYWAALSAVFHLSPIHFCSTCWGYSAMIYPFSWMLAAHIHVLQGVCKYVRGRMEASFPTHYFFECRCISHSKLAQRPSTRRKFTWLVVWFNIITLTVTHFTRKNWSRARASVSISLLLRCSGTSCDADIPPTHL